MAKGTWRLADDPNDPIYTGGYVISSHNRRRLNGTDDEPVMYPYSQDVLHVGIGSLAELEKWRLVDVSWRIKDRRQLDQTRYYFGYVGVSQRAALFGREVFTGYLLLESHYDEKIQTYTEPEEMWGRYLWAYKGQLSNSGKSNLALKMLRRHWAHKKKEDKKLGWDRRLHNVQPYKGAELLSKQCR
ncbi:MAG: hypothetical protein O3B02_08415 [Proteobacteria bacterium]|nr:hypothetical protein [Pseudomonadota bacterium]